MGMRFNAKKFSNSADGVCKKALPESHRQALDGKEVIDGQIEYTVDGQEYYLYPVLPEWCDSEVPESEGHMQHMYNLATG